MPALEIPGVIVFVFAALWTSSREIFDHDDVISRLFAVGLGWGV